MASTCELFGYDDIFSQRDHTPPWNQLSNDKKEPPTSLDRDGMHLASALGPDHMRQEGIALDIQLDHALSLLRSQDAGLQTKGIETMQDLEYNALTIEKMTQQGHLDALCALTAAFMRIPQPEILNREIENEAGFRALHIMFKIGAVAEGFRAVAAAIVAIAMPIKTDSSLKDASAETRTGHTSKFPPLSHVLADSQDPLNLGDIDNHEHLCWNPLSLNLRGLPHGNRRAVQHVGMGSHLTVYTKASKECRNAFQTFVQLLPTGALFIGGKEQQVSVLSVVQGSTAELDAAFHINEDARACVFRVHAMPRSCALAASEPVSLAFGAASVKERDSWVQGVSIIAMRHGALSNGSAGSAADVPDTCALQSGGAPSYQGTVDASGLPCGCGIALSPDGSKHIGNWEQGMLSGKGALLLPSGGKYMGEWRDGLAHGVGVELRGGGARYEGEWAEDAWHGAGMEFSSEGLVFCGNYFQGQRHGGGVAHDPCAGALPCSYEHGTLLSQESPPESSQQLSGPAQLRVKQVAPQPAPYVSCV